MTQDLPNPETPPDYKLALFHLREGNLAEAHRLGRRLVETETWHVPSWCLLGDTYLANGQPDEALRCWDEAFRIKPGHALASTRASSLRFRRAWGAPPAPRTRPAGADVLQVSALGARGRFGNQLFQYAYARLYAERHGLVLETADWVGRDLYGLDEPLARDILPKVPEGALAGGGFTALASPEGDPQLRNADLHGYFSRHGADWAPYRDAFRRCFRPAERLRAGLDGIVDRLRAQGRTLVVLHLRRGDFGYGAFWAAPASWYRAALERLWPTLDQPVLVVASDDPDAKREFAAWSPVDLEPAGFDMPGLAYFIDHHVMTQADVLMIANSTFSYTAAMLNERATQHLRPDPAAQALVPYDPWNAPVSLSADEAQPPILPVQQRYVAMLVQDTDHVAHLGRYCSAWTNTLRRVRPAVRVHEYEPGEGLDALRERHGLKHVQHLAIEDLSQLDALIDGAANTLALARVDFIHFTMEAGSDHRAAFDRLQALGYRLHGLADGGVYAMDGRPMEVRTAGLAIHERIVPLLLRKGARMLDLAQECARHGIRVKGVIHVGAHEGKEIGEYEAMGAGHVVYVEANPAVFERLERNIVARPQPQARVTLVHRAVSNTEGTLKLHLASMDQSSSILPMGVHQELYPQIHTTGSIDVRTSRLDTLMVERALPPTEFNLLNIDVQGAEAMVLEGAPGVLTHMDAVNVEVNFDDLYRGGAQIEDIEARMRQAGFRRVALTCPYHPTWGDALYVRDRLAA